MSESAAGAMDVIYRHQRFIYDLTRRHYLLGRDQMIADLMPPAGGSVLEVGCGTARNLICAARRYQDARFFGLDVSEEMLKTARAAIARSGESHRIDVAQADATAFSPDALFGLSSFDRIFISYAVSMIPPWEAVIDHAASILAPGGTLHVVDFGTMHELPNVARKAMLAWLAHFSVTPRMDLQDVVRTIAGRHGFSSSFHQGRFGYAAMARISR